MTERVGRANLDDQNERAVKTSFGRAERLGTTTLDDPCAEYLKPNMMADYSNALADKFNTFYNALPVIKAESPEISEARLALTDAIRTVLSNALNLIGVVAPQKM